MSVSRMSLAYPRGFGVIGVVRADGPSKVAAVTPRIMHDLFFDQADADATPESLRRRVPAKHKTRRFVSQSGARNLRVA
jgi:hypothetical protein